MENTVRGRSDVSSNDYANLWRTSMKQSTTIKRTLAGTPTRPINGSSAVGVSPDFAFCMTLIRNFSKPCLTKNVVFKWKGTYWRILCGNNSERLIWHWNLAMQGDSCRAFLPLRYRSGHWTRMKMMNKKNIMNKIETSKYSFNDNQIYHQTIFSENVSSNNKENSYLSFETNVPVRYQVLAVCSRAAIEETSKHLDGWRIPMKENIATHQCIFWG